MAARVPAWKRLGLKLKGASDDSSAPAPVPTHTPSNVSQARVNGSPASALKRKLPPSQTPYNSNSNYTQTPNKRLRGGDQTPGSHRKSVSFTADTKTTSVEPAKKKAKKPKKPKKEPAPKAETNLEPSLEYLRQWQTSRDSWKFNKNHQTLLIKFIFSDDTKIPSADVPIFYQYIRDLQGAVRTRLRAEAAEISKKDMDQGIGGFPASTKDKETKQAQYEEVISRFLKDLSSSSNGTNANGKRSLDETEYVIRTADPVIKQRLLKRIRAEMVRAELGSDSEETTTTETTEVSKATETNTTTSSSSSSSAATARQEPAAADSRPRRTDGSQQPTKRRRLRNVRTDISNGESSSSESDSDGGSSDDESEDEEMGNAPGNEDSSDSDSSTSSESSSDSDSESDSDAEANDAAAEESSSSSSSSSSSDSDSD
ncbi:hypothetical protein QBC43DRAFT_240948 [Cladorrhinum sp. PSN259]|nr:hypothetical protein QBC43DRAFT_240948 [Cladorrhinum sp. PSN259]